jgi:hypothetical protein
MKRCIDCQARIGIRATRCPDCRRAHRTRYERERAQGIRPSERPVDDVDDLGLPVVNVAPGEVVSDGKSVPGQAHQFPSPYAPKPAEPMPTEVMDPRVESPATRQARRTPQERSRIPSWVRQDRQRYHAEVAAQNRPPRQSLAPNGMNWNDLDGLQKRFGMNDEPNEPHVFDAYFTNSWDNERSSGTHATMVDGGRRGGRGYGVDALGRSVRR